jgi:hypothetical protein
MQALGQNNPAPFGQPSVAALSMEVGRGFRIAPAEIWTRASGMYEPGVLGQAALPPSATDSFGTHLSARNAAIRT